MSDLPSGIVTLLSVDLEDSASPAQASHEAYRDRMADHRRLVLAAVAEAGGQEVEVRGAHILAVFVRIRDAVDAAAAIQRAAHDGLLLTARASARASPCTRGSRSSPRADTSAWTSIVF